MDEAMAYMPAGAVGQVAEALGIEKGAAVPVWGTAEKRRASERLRWPGAITAMAV
ncbi:MAG: hypothetical protein TU35_007785 [Thermoproteus sp. AZ2]|uniref:Uncharacterized protein n=1 Tax=Thermoproteus sp. AZ2 TaxID=1609232 RepID=A0ACC6V2G1_9CREN